SPPPCPPRARASGATMSWATKTKDCPQQPYTSSSRARCCGSPSPSTNPATTSSRRKSNLFDNNHRIFRGDDGGRFRGDHGGGLRGDEGGGFNGDDGGRSSCDRGGDGRTATQREEEMRGVDV